MGAEDAAIGAAIVVASVTAPAAAYAPRLRLVICDGDSLADIVYWGGGGYGGRDSGRGGSDGGRGGNGPVSYQSSNLRLAESNISRSPVDR